MAYSSQVSISLERPPDPSSQLQGGESRGQVSNALVLPVSGLPGPANDLRDLRDLRDLQSPIPSWDELLVNGVPGPFEFVACSFPLAFDDPVGGSSAYPAASCFPPPPASSSLASEAASHAPAAPVPIAAKPRRLSPAQPKPTTKSHKRRVVAKASAALLPSMSAAMATSAAAGTAMKLEMAPPTATSSGTQIGRWTKKEHELFLEGLQRFGKSWKKISSLVLSRTLVQIRTHAQKYLQKQSRAALKADAKAAAAAAREGPKSRPKAPQPAQIPPICSSQPRRTETEPSPGQAKAPATSTAPSAVASSPWKPHNSGFVPLAFPSTLSASAVSSSSTSPRSGCHLNSVSKLDQLLQDDMTTNSSIPAFVDEYYSSPTAIEDDLLRPLYTGEPQWVPRLALSSAAAALPANVSNKRRRLEPLDGGSSPSASRAAVYSPATYPQRQTPPTAALLASQKPQEGATYCNPWL
ncbi:hypothetical protein BBJ28_00006186 [Nothophytophthora sp. Chile5]|nr:hypothetical protein BBJ28_00006186 [Nothophytophthora sp. Chile5]